MVDPSTREKRLEAMLAEDVGPEQAQDLLPLLLRLESSPPPVDKEKKAGLVRALRTVPAGRPTPIERLADWGPLLLLRAQARIVQREVWLASTLILVLGVLVTILADGSAGTSETLPIVLLAPLAAAAGTALVYNGQSEQALEVEQSTPVPLAVILLARLALVFAFNCGLALGGSAVLAACSARVVFWPLVLTWLAPMAALSMLAFFLSVASKEPLVGITVSMSLWFLLSIGRLAGPDIPFFTRLPDLTAAGSRPWLLALALVCLVLALRDAGRPARLQGGAQ